MQGLSNLKIKKTSLCKGCVLDKHAETSFLSSEHILRKILDMIHSNVYGPMSPISLLSYIYYVSFIDDPFRKIEIFFMKTKDEVFGKLTTLYNPQQNGVIDRKNRPIIKIEKAMIHDLDFPMLF